MQYKLIRALVAAAWLFVSFDASAAIVFRAAGTISSSGVPGQPAGKASGDLLLMVAAARAAAETLNAAPAGWTLLGDTSSTTKEQLALYCRVATADANDDVSHDFWSGTSSHRTQIAAFDGGAGETFDCSTVIAHGPAVSGSDSNTADLPNAALTVTTANTVVVGVGHKQKTVTSDGMVFALPAWADADIGEQALAGSAVAFVWSYDIQTTATTIASGIWDQSVEESLAYSSIVISLKAVTTAVFTVNPTVTAQDTNDYTLGGTTSGSVTVSAAACAKDTTAPTIAQVVAGNCTGNVAALAAVNEVWNGANDFILGGALPLKIYDLYATEGTNLVTLADEALDVPAGKERTTLTSVHATSPYAGSAVATGDICDTDAVTSPTSYVVTPSVDGTVEYAAGGDTSRQVIVADCHDISASAILDFTLVFNNQTCSVNQPLFEGGSFLYRKSVAITALDIKALCVDPEGDTVTAVTTSALPAGLSIAAGSVTGTPTTCGTTNTGFQWSDLYAATYAETGTFAIGDLVPDVANVAEASAITTIQAVCSLTATAGSPVKHSTIAVGNVVSTSPTIGTLVIPTQVVIYFLSSGPWSGGIRLGSGVGLGVRSQ